MHDQHAYHLPRKLGPGVHAHTKLTPNTGRIRSMTDHPNSMAALGLPFAHTMKEGFPQSSRLPEAPTILAGPRP